MKPKILFVINTNTYFSGLINVALLCKASSQNSPVIYFDTDYETRPRDIDLCNQENILYITRQQQTEKFASGLKILSYLTTTFFDIIKIKLFRTLNFYCYEKLLVSSIFKNIKPSLIILGGDNVWYNTGIFIKKAHKNNIKALIFAQWMAGPLEPAEVVSNNPDYSLDQFTNRLVGALFPKWVYRHKNKKLLRLPGDKVLAREILRISPPLPWVLHSGDADTIAVESQAMKNYCLKHHLPQNKIEITGSIENDRIYEIQKSIVKFESQFKKKYQLPPDLPIILTALPPDFLYLKGGRPECEFKNYRDLVEFWIKSLVDQKEYSIAVSIHPSVKYENIKYLEDWGVKIIKENIFEIIPFCYFLVASVSSVIQWAISCGLPVINYDVYKYHYSDYDEAKGVIYTTEKNEYIELLSRLATDANYYEEIKKLQVKASKNWGQPDGQSSGKVLTLINQSINKP